MEEPNAAIEVSTSRDLCSEIKNGVNDCSYGSSKDEMGFSMPICFLVKEQAKSLIAIQELQKRLDHVENVQEDVIDAIIEFRNYLSDTKSFSNTNRLVTSNSLSTTQSPAAVFSKLNSAVKSPENNVPSAAESSVEVPHSIVKLRSFSSKDCDHRFSEYAKSQMPELSQKHFDLIKSKDSALESDKQDSGLDSDCREHHEIHPSLCKNVPNSANEDGNDELLQLLDEISYRSTILQKQLAIVEEVTPLADIKKMTARSRTPKKDFKANSCMESKFLGTPCNRSVEDQERQSEMTHLAAEDRTCYTEEKVPIAVKQNSGFVEWLQGKPSRDRLPSRKRAANGIDSNVVSSILKETNVVDLQRQALIYLVDNAVLNTKLREAEQTLLSKRTENEKVENTLKEEARLLMMENRELRISLDEQKIENNNLKSRLVMLERVVQSVNNENQELNWQLSESLNLHNLSKKGSLNYSSIYRSDNPVGTFRSTKRPQSSFHSDRNVQNLKSKLLSNNNFMDVSEEDPDPAPSASASFLLRNRPIYSSTPMMPLQKKKETEVGMAKSQSDMSPANFQSVKKCLKSSYSSEQDNTFQKSSKSGRCLDETHSSNIPETCSKKFPQNTTGDALTLDTAGKFPFSTILEKLKSNSEYRLSKSASARIGELGGDKSESFQVKSSANNTKVSLQDSENISHFKEAKISPQEKSADVILQRRKGKNIHQRIQNILDRIVAESEEAS
ncbi:uncharacterized protein TNIN_348531 [Trichonephila inaurata madagascariensis]|uniref:Uncharacterized protein n=1 Tax=Trichonephila inaurata madagascariensis TaxID=2747483 RepID=A0A8X7BPG9_9ARAC|nr:uncharacterized protein TNIN_348531 [Trichonephila inaurata madagascariensis]